MRLFSAPVLTAILFTLTTQAADSKNPKPPKPCTITSSTSGSFFDLNAITVVPLEDRKKSEEDDRKESWHAKGYDYGANFTLNFCAPVIENLTDVVGVDEKRWGNVSAYYVKGGKTYSIGQESSELVFRGRKLVMNYTEGSPCDDSTKHSRGIIDDDDDDDNDDDEDNDGDDKHGKKGHKSPSKGSGPSRRKSTIISLLCDRDSLASKASIAFVGASPDECTYFFEVRSAAACGGVSQETQSVGPGGVFGIILLIAAAVYLFGGIAYQRTVMHQRGWRQLPNYNIWAGMASFAKDILIIATSSCARCLPSRKGYNQLPMHSDSRGSGRGSRAEDENRLIDQLDEEWDD